MKVLSHRGIGLGQQYDESSKAAFAYALENFHGIEFDLQMTKDQKIVVWHDQDAKRLTGGQFSSSINSYSFIELQKASVFSSPLCLWQDVIQLMREFPGAMFAMHLKGGNQNKVFIQRLVDFLKIDPLLHQQILIFDCHLASAKLLKRELPAVNLALSVSDPYDIERFNSNTNGTLYSIEVCKDNRQLTNWAWMDEWDLLQRQTTKPFCNQQNIQQLKNLGLNVAVVSPELHATSPGLIGGGGHPDGHSLKSLQARWSQWKSWGVDAICTDYATDLLKVLNS